jgi:hypothetical protein
VGRAGLRTHEAEVMLVERLRCGEVGCLEIDEVGAGDSDGDAPPGLSVC